MIESAAPLSASSCPGCASAHALVLFSAQRGSYACAYCHRDFTLAYHLVGPSLLTGSTLLSSPVSSSPETFHVEH